MEKPFREVKNDITHFPELRVKKNHLTIYPFNNPAINNQQIILMEMPFQSIFCCPRGCPSSR